MAYAKRVLPGEPANLTSFDTKQDGGLSKEESERRLDFLGEQLDDLQDLLYAAGTHSVLVIMQGMDTSGKDGAIRHVFRYVDPLGCRVWPFKVPTPLELGHDFLWRIHDKAPEAGYMAVFNRSHYEDVVVVRVHELVPESVWRSRYEHILNFEQMLIDGNTIIVKFFLHISKDEQEERLLAREDEVEKAWKLSADDWRKREFWDDYMLAYEEAINRCTAELAPWYIVPSDRKWFRDLGVMETMVNTLEPYRANWLDTLAARGNVAKAEIDVLQNAAIEVE